MSTYFEDTNLVEGVNSTVTSGGTLALVASSKTMQRLTGTSNHTVTLPDATTLKNAGRRFHIMNRSTGSVTVNNFSGTLIATLTTNTQRDFVVSDVSSAAGVWELAGDSGSTGGGGSASVQSTDTIKMLQGLAGLNYNDGSIIAKRLKVNVEEIGANVWIQRSALATAQARNPAMSVNGYLYNVGGQSSVLVERYDDTNNYWIARANVTASQGSKSGCFDISGVGYSAGGDNGTAVTSKYVDTTNVWSAVSSMPSATTDTSSFALNGFGYVPGGANSTNGTVQNFNYRYNSTLDSWSTRQQLTTARYLHKSLALNGVGYVVAGENSSFSPIATGEKYSDQNNSWQSIASVGTTNGHTGGFQILGMLYVYQGATDFERYADFTNVWLTVAPSIFDHTTSGGGDLNGFGYQNGANAGGTGTRLDRYSAVNYQMLGSFLNSSVVPSTVLVATALKGIAAGVPVQIRTDGERWYTFTSNADSVLRTSETLKAKFQPNWLLYIMGGGVPLTATALTEMYSDTANTWTNRQSMGTARVDCFGFNLDGLYYSIGGSTSLAGTTGISSTERYNELTNAWTARATLPGTRASQGAFTLLGFGYIASGNTNGDFTTGDTVTRKYNGATDSFTLVTGPGTAVSDMTCINLYDRGYLMNGYNTSNTGVSNNQQYDPLLDSWANKTAVTISGGYASGFTLNGYGYTGCMSGNTSAVRKYDTNLDSWASVASTGSSHLNGGASSLNGFGYFYCEQPSAVLEQYNDGANSYTTKASLNTSRRAPSKNSGPGTFRKYEIKLGVNPFIAGVGAGVWVALDNLPISGTDNPGNAAVNGFGYAVGGRNGGSNIQSTQKFTDSTKSWTQSFNMASAAMGEVPCGTANGFVYNSKGGTGLNTSQKFNDQTGWVSVASSSASLNSSTSACLNGLYYVTGGSGPSTNVEQYTDQTNAWATKTSLTTARATHGTFNQNGYLYVASGASNQAAEQYNDASNAWITKATCNTTQDDAATFTLAGNGYLAGNTSSSTSVEKYLDGSNVWVSAASLTTGGYGCATGAAFGGNGYAFGLGPSTFNKCHKFSASLNDIILGIALEAK